MTPRDAHKRILTVQKLLLEPTTTREKVRAVRTLIKGIRPELDQALSALEREFSIVEKALEGDVVTLAAERLPETTEEEKKRKKALLFFVNYWNKLKGEVARVEAELAAAGESNDQSQKQSHWGTILKHSVGPLGVITAVAVGLVLLKTTSVEVFIQNDGCGTMKVANSLPVPIPGFSLPDAPIPDGGSSTAALPPVTVHIDGTGVGALNLKTFNFEITFDLPNNISDVTLDGTSLLGTETEVRLGERDEHLLTLTCS